MNILKYFSTGIRYIISSPFKIVKYFCIGIKSIFLTLPLTIIYKITKKEKKLSNIILLLSLSTYLLCIFILTRWYVQNERTKKFTQSITNQEVIEERIMLSLRTKQGVSIKNLNFLGYDILSQKKKELLFLKNNGFSDRFKLTISRGKGVIRQNGVEINVHNK